MVCHHGSYLSSCHNIPHVQHHVVSLHAMQMRGAAHASDWPDQYREMKCVMIWVMMCRCVEQLMRQIGQSSTEMMVASHNQCSIEKAVDLMHQLGLSPSGSGAASPHRSDLIVCPIGLQQHILTSLSTSKHAGVPSGSGISLCRATLGMERSPVAGDDNNRLLEL